MKHVTSLASKAVNIEYLNQFLESATIEEKSFNEAQRTYLNSNSTVGSLIEQLILIKAYKKESTQAIYPSVKAFCDRLKLLVSSIESDAKRIDSYSCCKHDSGMNIFYNDFHLDKISILQKYYSVDSIRIFNSPFNFVNSTDEYRFQCSNGTLSETLLIYYPTFVKLIKACSNKLINEVYTKKEISDNEIVKLLLFENTISNSPIYLSGAFSSYQQSAAKLFCDYDDIVNAVCYLERVNRKMIDSVGTLLSYQEQLSVVEITGRVDFLTSDSIIEIKAGNKATRNDLLQALIYGLMTKTKEGSRFKHIKYVKILYLNLGKIIIMDINSFTKSIKETPSNVLEGLLF